MRSYLLAMEVAGPLAMFTRVDTGGTPTSYPAPTWSAAKGLLDAVAFLADGAAWIEPIKVEVCRRRGAKGGSVRYESYATNYGGPLRKPSLVAGSNSMQLHATVLADAGYRIHAEVRGEPAAGRNPRRHLHELFARRLERSQCHHAPALGWREFTCSYWGPFRRNTEVDEALSLTTPSMLLGAWDRPVSGTYAPRYAQDVRIESGCWPMLNELLALERGLTAAGFEVVPPHADVSRPRLTEAIHVRLDARGVPVEVAAMGRDGVASLWMLSDGQHSSFPFVQLKQPLLAVPADTRGREEHARAWRALAPSARRQLLRDLARDRPTKVPVPFGPGLRGSLGRRQAALAGLGEPQAAVSAPIGRVPAIGDRGVGVLEALVAQLVDGLDDADDALLEASHAALVGQPGAKDAVVGIPLCFDVARGEFRHDGAEPSRAGPISRALSDGGAGSGSRGTCLMEGRETRLHAGSFPQPTVPALGRVRLFSENGDSPASTRHGRADAEGLPVGADPPQRLAGALVAVTADHHRGKAWQGIPGEKAKASDLLIAFMRGAPEVPVAGVLCGSEPGQDDGFGEETGHLDAATVERAGRSRARGDYLHKAGLVVQAVQAKVGADFRETPVDLLVLRKVDTGSTKAILHRALSVGEFHDAATAWAEALGNVPDWLTMPALGRDRRVRRRGPPAIAPLALPRATRALFVCGGTERAGREPVGIRAADALALFLGEQGSERIAQATLRTVLARQGGLLAGAAHALRRDAGLDGLRHALKYDRAAALQAAALLGVLLARAGRRTEDTMSDAAFRLGQLLAMADAVHLGFCVDERGGQVPATLLGDGVLVTAQSDPQRAVSMLCRRWKPYGGWRQRADCDEARRLTERARQGAVQRMGDRHRPVPRQPVRAPGRGAGRQVVGHGAGG